VPRTTPHARIDEPVHVILGTSAAGSLWQVGGRESIILHDTLCPGPCDVNPARHLRKRRAYLAGNIGPGVEGCQAHFDALNENLLDGHEFAERIAAYPSVVFWTSLSWTDRLAFWWALDALKHSSVGPGRGWVAEPRLPAGHGQDYHPPPSLGAFAPREFKAAFADLRPLTTKAAQAGASLWRKFAAASPPRVRPGTSHPFGVLPRPAGDRRGLRDLLSARRPSPRPPEALCHRPGVARLLSRGAVASPRRSAEAEPASGGPRPSVRRLIPAPPAAGLGGPRPGRFPTHTPRAQGPQPVDRRRLPADAVWQSFAGVGAGKAD
jgi:hypothetical protein